MTYLRLTLCIIGFAASFLVADDARAQQGPRRLSRSERSVLQNQPRAPVRRRRLYQNPQPALHQPVHEAPELDPAGASAVGMIVIGAGLILLERRRRTA